MYHHIKKDASKSKRERTVEDKVGLKNVRIYIIVFIHLQKCGIHLLIKHWVFFVRNSCSLWVIIISI